MWHRREAISVEALERAIRARLAIQFGATSEEVLARFEIEPWSAEDSVVNWHLAEAAEAAQAAAAEVAHRFNLRH